jgi:F-type H+-transporting ATPase subunit b
MKFDIWTLLFQIINFFVLLFILKRLLYKPVKEIIEKRKEMIEKKMEKAHETELEALELRKKTEEELKKLAEHKVQALEKIREEAEDEKKRLIAEAEKDVKAVIEKEKALFDLGKRKLDAELKDRAVDTVSVFASNLLRDLSDEDIHGSIMKRLLHGLDKIAADVTALKGEGNKMTIDLATAYPIEEGELENIRSALESSVSRKVSIITTVDRDLIAGIKLRLQDIVYDFSLAGQIEALKTRLKEGL